jgi:hypothetical protein
MIQGEQFWDAHIHLFPERLFAAIWGWFDRFGWDIPFAGWDLASYLSFLQDMGVDRGFLLPYCHKPGMAMDLNRWVGSVALAHPWLIPFASVHPGDEGIAETLALCLDSWGFAGLKLQLAVIGYPADHPALIPACREVYQRDKILIIHAGTAPYAPGQEEYKALGLRRVLPLLEAFPGLKLIIPHFGLDELDLMQEILEAYPNVSVDTSWALANPKLEVPESELARFMITHKDRILFGTDFPILEHSPRDMLAAVNRLVPDPEVRRLILHANAQRLVAGNDAAGSELG